MCYLNILSCALKVHANIHATLQNINTLIHTHKPPASNSIHTQLSPFLW